MQLAHLEVFLAVVEEGSFAAAAKSLYLAPSRATERIQQLERELQVALFDRFGRRLEPTQAGLALIPRAQAITRELELIRTLFRTDETPGIRVGMRSVPADVREALQSHLRKVGRDRVTVVPLDSATQVQLMQTGRLDCGFVWQPPPAPLKSIPILSEALAVAVPATERFKSLDVLDPSDLAGLNLASTIDPLAVPMNVVPYLEFLPRVDMVNPAVAGAIYLMVSSGRHCAFVAQASTDHSALSSDTRRNILIKPLRPPAPVIRTFFAWHPDLEDTPLLAAVLDRIRRSYPVEEIR
ncbi:LysR family transcriptional regulator [Nocardia tengchongensis]|uniref:LysR family transcriptional regulator n=1 Tax=Nocardia tengchongensis TaxID=2055889 RepID=UPI0036C3761F